MSLYLELQISGSSLLHSLIAYEKNEEFLMYSILQRNTSNALGCQWDFLICESKLLMCDGCFNERFYRANTVCSSVFFVWDTKSPIPDTNFTKQILNGSCYWQWFIILNPLIFVWKWCIRQVVKNNISRVKMRFHKRLINNQQFSAW